MSDKGDIKIIDQLAADEAVERTEWLSLGEASKVLGVHYTTLRSWADRGEIPVFRTPGGHRRFRPADLRRFMADRDGTALVADSHELVNVAVDRTRQHIRQMTQRQRWLASNDEDARELRRQRGRQLFTLAISYVMKSRQRQRILIDGRALGLEYGEEAAISGVSLSETGQAVQFFRQQLVSTIQEGGDTGVLDAEDVHIQRLLNQFVDEVLFAVLEGYERCIIGQPTIADEKMDSIEENPR